MLQGRLDLKFAGRHTVMVPGLPGLLPAGRPPLSSLQPPTVLSANPRFDELKATGKLPSPAGVALAVIELCRRDGTGIDEIAHAVRADPALSGRVIKFANAAAHGPRRPVVSVPEAIRMVGVNTVRQLVLGFSLLGQYRAGACKAFDYGRFWSRSLAMAIAAHGLCQRVRGAQPDEAFTCGLLAGVGHLALVTLYPNEMGELLTAHPQRPADRADGGRARALRHRPQRARCRTAGGLALCRACSSRRCSTTRRRSTRASRRARASS